MAKNSSPQPASKAEKATQAHSNQPSLVSDNTVLTLTIPADQAQQAYQKQLRKAAQKVKAEGFRKGKVPLKLVEEKIGQAEIIEKAVNSILPEAYSSLIAEHKKQPLGNPSFQLKSAQLGQDWEVEVQIAEKPTITLGNYKKSIKAGHTSAKKHLAEQEKQAKTTKKTKQQSAKEADPAQTKPDQESVKLHHIFRELVTSLQPQIPELLVKQETERQLRQLVQQLDQLKLSLDDYLQRRNQSFDELSTEMAAQSLGQLQLEFILQAIGTDQKIEVKDEEIKAEVEKNFPKNPEAGSNPYVQSQIRHALQRKKITDFLLNAA